MAHFVTLLYVQDPTIATTIRHLLIYKLVSAPLRHS